jgi:hypothetical protein
LTGNLFPHRLDSPVQLSLINRVLKSEGVHRPGPLFILFGMAPGTLLRGNKLNRRLVPFKQGRIIGIEFPVYVKNLGCPKGRSTGKQNNDS